jgi:hypothetical protein
MKTCILHFFLNKSVLSVAISVFVGIFEIQLVPLSPPQSGLRLWSKKALFDESCVTDSELAKCFIVF